MLVYANVLQPLIDVMDAILRFWHGILGSWGLSIIALTMVVRLAILPLTFKQVRSMQELQRLQPEIKKIQERYKDDRQRQQQEMMRFYQEHKVNPLGSCLPILLQFPFFIGLFYMLRKDLKVDICGPKAELTRYVQEHHTTLANVACDKVDPGSADFLFISDLTHKAMGATLAVLIVLYVSTQLVSSLVSTMTADKNQRRIMLALPFLFVTFILQFPAGLIVYWITTNTWTIGQQLLVKRFLPTPAPVGAPAGGDGKPPKSAPTKPRPSEGGRAARAGAGAKEKAERSDGSDGRPRKAPPPSPRKKKKRTGRRR
jgi:YidC/Oxa1 family membrane protein insertase